MEKSLIERVICHVLHRGQHVVVRYNEESREVLCRECNHHFKRFL